MRIRFAALMLTALCANAVAAPSAITSAKTSNESSSTSQFDIGLILIEPDGLSVHIPVGHDRGLALALGSGDDSEEDTHFHADYLFYQHGVFKGGSDVRIPAYVGFGVVIAEETHYERRGRGEVSDDRTVFGARVPLGVLFSFRQSPIDVFAEIVPTLELTPDSEFEIEAGVGVRLRIR